MHSFEIFFLIKFVIFLLGIIFMFTGIILMRKHKNRQTNCTTPAQATVLENQKVFFPAETEQYSWFPIIKYTINGKGYKTRHYHGTAKEKYKIGEVIDILYNPEKPEEYIIIKENSFKRIEVIFVFVGFILLSIFSILNNFN